MRRYNSFILIAVVVCFLATDGLAQSDNAFEKIKALEGDWKGIRDGHPVEISYKVMSGGSALVETLMPKGELNMVTGRQADDDALLLGRKSTANDS